MRTFFIEWIRKHMTDLPVATPPASPPAVSRPPTGWDQAAAKAIGLPPELKDCRPLWSLELREVDTQPSIHLAGTSGYFLDTEDGRFILFPQNRPVPPNAKEGIKQSIQARCKSSKSGLPIYLGQGRGWHWFAYASADVCEYRCLEWGLAGGDDRLQLLVDRQAFGLMPRIGARAVPHLQSVLSQGTEALPPSEYQNRNYEADYIARALVALSLIDDPSAKEALDAVLAADGPYTERNAMAFLTSTAEGYYLSVYVRPSPPEDLQRRIAEVLSRNRTDQERIEFIARWTRRAQHGLNNSFTFGVIVYMLKTLPPDVWDKPLSEILADNTNSGHEEADERWWDDMRRHAKEAAQNPARSDI